MEEEFECNTLLISVQIFKRISDVYWKHFLTWEAVDIMRIAYVWISESCGSRKLGASTLYSTL